MPDSPFAYTPAPPHSAVIFASQRQGDAAGYGAMPDRIEARARGRGGWYTHFHARVADAQRAHGGPVVVAAAIADPIADAIAETSGGEGA